MNRASILCGIASPRRGGALVRSNHEAANAKIEAYNLYSLFAYCLLALLPCILQYKCATQQKPHSSNSVWYKIKITDTFAYY